MLVLFIFWGCVFGADGIPTGPDAACYCSDVSPRNDNNTVDYNCQQQLEQGNCNANFMRQTVKEVPEGEVL